MLLSATMMSAGAIFPESTHFIGGGNTNHFISILLFFLLWRLHRSVGRKFFEKVLEQSSSSSSLSSSSLSSSMSRTCHSKQAFLGTEHGSNSKEGGNCCLITSSINNDDMILLEKDDEFLRQQIPESTSAERLRFYIARKKNKSATARSLTTYLSWRRQCVIPDSELPHNPNCGDDASKWSISCAIALKMHGEDTRLKMPQFVRCYRDNQGEVLLDSMGARIFHFLPGLIDDRVCKTTIYATALAIYLDKNLLPDSNEKVSIVIDVRGGKGWRNIHAANQLPFIQSTSKLLLTMFPERLARAVVHPIPSGFVWLWKMASRCIDIKTRNKIGLLSGTATIDSPPPTEQMLPYMSRDVAHRLEAERVASFQ